ncbi:MAG: acyltransferase [Sphingobacteriales bacterium]|nr:acyltransferase [Sphingobacteriales bacterium]
MIKPAQPNLANPQTGRQYFPALDGLRGLAILLVVIYHNFGFIEKYFFFGWLGVDLFFVLSGFLITNILLKELGSKNYLKNFYVRRILRIFPLYYLCLILFLILLPQLNTSLDLKYYTDNQGWIWAYLQNWLYIFKPPADTSTLNHLWSLAVEEQFYLLWPLVILLLKRPKYLFVFISLLLMTVLGLRLWIWMHHLSDFSYYNLYTFTRIDGICIGSMVALLQRIHPGFLKKYTSAIVLFFAALNFAFFFVNRFYQFSFPYLALAGYTTFAMIFGLLVNEAVARETKLINLIFNIPLLKFFGRISYGFYMFHWPVYLLLSPVLFSWIQQFSSGWITHFSVSVIGTLAAVLLSWLSFNYYEKHFLKLKNRFA